MSDSRQFPLIQKVRVNEGAFIVPDHIVRCSIIESADMSGTKLILELYDPVAAYRDELKIKEGTELEVTYGDPGGRGGDIFIDTFVVMPPKFEDNIFHVEGFQRTCHQLKQPVKTPTFFVEQTPEQILNRVLTGVKIECDTFNEYGTYHLNAGTSKSKLIRTMARDYGAIAYYSRGSIYFKSVPQLKKRKFELSFEHQNPDAEISISSFRLQDQTYMYDRLLNRMYARWDTEEGLQVARAGGENGFVMISPPFLSALDNQNITLIPVMWATTLGNTQIQPGLPCKVVFHLSNKERVIDEALPEKQYIQQVTHYQEGSRYLCLTGLGVFNESRK
ncbi:hypothetical protein L4174_023865 (plasmid) [Photobacterium sp. CCB-ST2H9]|uniref:hypothetical protein n=1 Tax=Photobacterium sp. CCB-ST2H9 TaxID=2912855 RepID=UPI002004F7C7|nr:hypothetical protein [Photobacterium sp. CCB-ST2H9]UTM60424.1 hypothetical protein L4174_023865 [Photobacterium sp. CCB-ST2H9]